MGLEFVQLDKRSGIEQEIDSLAGRHPPALPLLVQPLLAATEVGLPCKVLHPLYVFFKCHDLNRASGNIRPVRQSKQEHGHGSEGRGRQPSLISGLVVRVDWK